MPCSGRKNGFRDDAVSASFGRVLDREFPREAMPRKPRLHVPGGLYHVILRGNARQDIFFDPDDRQRWETLIGQGVRKYTHRIHAYCWMTNHVHLAVQCHTSPLSRFMSFVASGYARATNKKLNRSGHLFERRYRAILVQRDSYLQELIRYIHRNPLRAGIIRRLEDYPWSSHHAYVTGRAPAWLTTGWALSTFGTELAPARRRYAEFMGSEGDQSICSALRNGAEADQRALGDDQFLASIEARWVPPGRRPSLDQLISEACEGRGVSEAELRSRSRERRCAQIRAEIGLVAVDGGIATGAELARRFNRSQSALSRAIGRLRAQQVNK
ncbi:MAG: transposase [Gammaproteobacteria bacterium]|nr:MAG: transposase [Gammaproteobacteria bacterium]